MPEAFKNVETEETTETNELRGKIRFTYAAGEGLFQVSSVHVEMAYTDAAFLRWTIRFPVQSGALPELMPLLTTLGTTDGEVINLPADQHMEVTLVARPAVLARLSPALLRLNLLSDMFQADGFALLNLDNYEQGQMQIVSGQEAAAS